MQPVTQTSHRRKWYSHRRITKSLEQCEAKVHKTIGLELAVCQKKSLAQSAMSDMYDKADLLGKSRAVINVNIVYKNQFVLIYGKSKAIATGTVIEFLD